MFGVGSCCETWISRFVAAKVKPDLCYVKVREMEMRELSL